MAGLELARLADLPEDVLTESKRVAENLATLHARNEANSKSNQTAIRRKALLRVRFIVNDDSNAHSQVTNVAAN